MEGRHPLLGALQRTGFPDFLHRPCGSQTPEGPSRPTPRAGQEGDRPRAGTKLVHGRPWAGRPSPWQEARSSFGFGFGLILCPQRFELYPSGNFCWSDFITKVLKAYVRREPTSAGGPPSKGISPPNIAWSRLELERFPHPDPRDLQNWEPRPGDQLNIFPIPQPDPSWTLSHAVQSSWAPPAFRRWLGCDDITSQRSR